MKSTPMQPMLTSRTSKILSRIKKIEDAGRKMMDLTEKLYEDLESNLLQDHDVKPGDWVSNRYGKFLVQGVDNFTLEHLFQHEQPTLNGMMDGKGNLRIIHVPWKVMNDG